MEYQENQSQRRDKTVYDSERNKTHWPTAQRQFLCGLPIQISVRHLDKLGVEKRYKPTCMTKINHSTAKDIRVFDTDENKCATQRQDSLLTPRQKKKRSFGHKKIRQKHETRM